MSFIYCVAENELYSPVHALVGSYGYDQYDQRIQSSRQGTHEGDDDAGAREPKRTIDRDDQKPDHPELLAIRRQQIPLLAQAWEYFEYRSQDAGSQQ